MNLLRSALLLLSLLLVVWSGLSKANEEQNQRKRTLIIGRVSDNPRKHIKQIQPLAEYVLSKIGDLGINKVEVVFARNNKEMINFIKTGKVDWISESVYSALIFERQTRARIFLKRWKKNNSEYHSVFITRKDSGINDLTQLTGKTLVLEDSGSTSGFFLPVTELMKRKIPAIHLDTPQNPLLENQVGYVFAKKEINITAWVAKGLAHAGAFSNADWVSNSKTPAGMKKDLKVFYITSSYPRMLELLAPHVSKTIEDKLTRILLEAEFDKKGIKTLMNYQQTTRFEILDKPETAIIEHARAFIPKMQHLNATQ